MKRKSRLGTLHEGSVSSRPHKKKPPQGPERPQKLISFVQEYSSQGKISSNIQIRAPVRVYRIRSIFFEFIQYLHVHNSTRLDYATCYVVQKHVNR